MSKLPRLPVDELIDERYKVVDWINDGGMGNVYSVEDIAQGHRKLALKVLKARASESETVAARFLKEAMILRDLEHEHVVEYLSSGIPKHGPLYLVMEVLPGGSLVDLLEAAKQEAWPPFTLPSGLTRKMALELLRQCASGLAYAHDRGIAHRDLKPSNLLLCDPVEKVLETGEIRVKLADFGIASTDMIGSLNVTRQGAFVGTLSYAAPEHLEHVLEYRKQGRREGWERPLEQEKQGDMFALGLVMYELWTGTQLIDVGRRPGEPDAGDEQAILDRLRDALDTFHGRMDKLEPLEPEYELMRSLLDLDPARRPTARNTALRLDAPDISAIARPTYSDGYSGIRPAPEPPDVEPKPRRRRSAFAALVVMAALSVIVLALAFWWSGGHAPSLTALLSTKDNPTTSSAQDGVADKFQDETGAAAAVVSNSGGTEVPHEEPTITPTPKPLERRGKKVECGAWSSVGPLEKQALRNLGKPAMPLRLQAKDLVCKVDDDGGTYLDQFPKPGSRVIAPFTGTLRIYDSVRPDNRSRATCIVLEHEGHFWSKLCGLDSKKIFYPPGKRVRRGQALGQLDGRNWFNYELFYNPQEEGGSKTKGRKALDLRPILER